MILAMGLFYSVIAQIIAGIMEFKKGNTFGTTAFTSYGLFWLSLVFLKILPNSGLWSETDSLSTIAAYLFMWGVFTFFMFINTRNKNKEIQFVFLSLTILFFLLAIGDVIKEVTGSSLVTNIAGYEGIVCGASAIYLAMKEVYEETNAQPTPQPTPQQPTTTYKTQPQPQQPQKHFNTQQTTKTRTKTKTITTTNDPTINTQINPPSNPPNNPPSNPPTQKTAIEDKSFYER